MKTFVLSLVAGLALALTAGTASAHPPGYIYPGGYYGGYYGGYRPGPVYGPVYGPVHGRPVLVTPVVPVYSVRPVHPVYPGPGVGVRITVGFGNSYVPYGYPGFRPW